MGKYLVILVVALLATHLLLSRNKQEPRTATRKSIHRALESTVRKTAIAVGALIAALVVILLVKHVTS
ncbi:MAG TPA: hypothetical protein VHP37_25650 [Burkholderiales bacterium]|nr:hypothetical protein [Burkholderiales bacterium]